MRLHYALTLLIGALILGLGSAASAYADDSCARVVAPGGSDVGSGTVEDPFATVQQLVSSLAPGEAGCVRAGSYAIGEVSVRVAGVRLVAYPGERPTLAGRLRILAEGVEVAGLRLDGRNARGLPSPTINASNATFRDNDVTSPGGSSCFLLGGSGRVAGVVVERNRIHDCGDPATADDYGVHAYDTVGARIVGNWIYDNASRGIKLGPDADSSTVRGNVIDGNPIGLNFSGSGARVSSGNVVERNVIANPTRWNNVQAYWPDELVGEDNVVRDNCLFAGDDGDGGIGSQTGFSATRNLVGDPGFVDRAGKDFRLGADSPCLLTADTCDRVTAPDGDDGNPGSSEAPFATVRRLLYSLAPGETGCLRGGTYVDAEATVRVAGVRLLSYPGERASLVGRLRVLADDVVVAGLHLDGRNSRMLPSPTINGDRVVFRGNEVTHMAASSCFLLGSEREVTGVVVAGNRIHDCGDPATMYDHGIYVQDAVGTRIVGNWIYDNASRGIKLGPDADSSTVRGNVIDGNAVGLSFSGRGPDVSSGNVVERNVIANPRRWNNVQAYWPDELIGEGNVVRQNCLHTDEVGDGGLGSRTGFSAFENIVADPGYVDRAGEDFRLLPDSSCLAAADVPVEAPGTRTPPGATLLP